MKTLQFHQEIYELRPWYHNFEKLGLQTDFGDHRPSLRYRLAHALKLVFKPRGYVEKGEQAWPSWLLNPTTSAHQMNQNIKERYLLSYLEQALAELAAGAACLELFCADGYYSCLLKQRRADLRITGIDLDPLEVKRAATASQLLDMADLQFIQADVYDFVEKATPYDLILCMGGLYHLTDPLRLLQALWPVTNTYLTVQSVVTLETEDSDYFITPAPGWKHGSRFTHACLRRWLVECGWKIIGEARSELPGNPRPCDRGSSYFLCQKD